MNLDSGSGAAIEANAKSRGVKVIDYDRLTLKGSAAYYVSFDNVEVGKLQGQGLVEVPDELGAAKPAIAELNGSPTDNNATLFKQGYDSVLKPLYDAGKATKVADQSVPDWDNQQALTIFEQMLQKTNNKIDGVLAANDGLGNSAISALKARKLKQLPVTGQDATPQGIQNILAGDQCMTVYKAVKKEADAASKLAIALAKGEQPEAGLVNGKTNDTARDVPSVLLTPAGDHQGQRQGGLRRRLPEAKRGCLHRQVRRAVHGGRHLLVKMATGAPPPAAPHRPRGPGGGVESVTDAPILELRGVSKSFGAVQALYEVDFHVRAGEVMALVGDNGAGKSTLIKCIAGIYSIDSGEVLFEGEPRHRSTARRTRRAWASRSSTRTSRWPTTSTSCRTCSSAARSSTGSLRSLDELDHGEARQRHAGRRCR